MSDLHRAVEDEIDAFRPDRTPPFGALMDRHRTRNRRRKMLAVAPVVAAVLVAPVAWSAATGGGDQLVQQAAPADEADSSRAAFRTQQEGRRSLLALTSGYLSGDRATGCLWLFATDTPASTASPILILHSTAVADFSRTPWVIRDGDTVLATEGDQVSLAGGGTPDGSDFSVPGCPVEGQPFVGRLNAETAPEQPAAESTRYTLLYDNEAAYDEQAQSVQACLDLAGVTDIHSEDRNPPLVSLAVDGAEQNAALRTCVSRLDGVLLSESPPRNTLALTWPESGPPPGRKYVPAPFAVETISPDRRSITVRVAGIAGGCTGQAYGRAVETAEGVKAEAVIDVPLDENVGCNLNLPTPSVTITLPRPLGADEIVLGQCESNEETPEGRTCSAISPAG